MTQERKPPVKPQDRLNHSDALYGPEASERRSLIQDFAITFLQKLNPSIVNNLGAEEGRKRCKDVLLQNGDIFTTPLNELTVQAYQLEQELTGVGYA